MRKLFILFIVASVFACGDSSSASSDDSATSSTSQSDKNEAPSASGVLSGGPYTLTPFGDSPAFTDAEIKSYSYKDGKFDFTLADGEYQLGAQTADAPNKMCANSAKGQHIHLIIDNKPYAAKYTSSFEYDIEDGEHYLLAFLSRSYHESIKTPKAYVAEKIMVKNKSIVAREPITEPMLFYSRPKGTYVGAKDTEKIMLDYYVINTEIGKDHYVRVTMNDQAKFILDKWQPYYVEGLGAGSNAITLSLLDADQRMIKDMPLLPVTREFSVKNDVAE